jgi:ergothioneine biosynthesis protein EgtB
MRMTISTVERLAQTLERQFTAARERTRWIFSMVAPEAYETRAIPLRHPFVFYDGHLDAFLYNLVLKGALGQPSVNADFDALFARGIDPEDEAAAASKHVAAWPDRQAIRQYKAEIALRLDRALRDPSTYTRDGLRGGELYYMALEHELMHQETLLYLIHQLPHALKRRPAGLAEPDTRSAPAPHMVEIPAGPALLGARAGDFPFTWDNERPAHERDVPAFAIDAYNVTNGEFLAFVEEGGYDHREFWTEESWAWKDSQAVAHPFHWRRGADGWLYRGLFEDVALPLSWPVGVTHAEASAYARYVGKALPSEAEWHRAAMGDRPDAPYPWGTEPPTAAHGNFDFQLLSPTRVGNYPAGASPYGVHDLVGNGWEWTATPFGPFEGFTIHPAYPGYSADFFDGKHVVMKGASWVTDRQLVRRSFRNWFYGNYPYMDASFRCVTRH